MIELLLEKIVDALLSAFADQVSQETMKLLAGDPTKKAFKKAIGAAIQRYATSTQSPERTFLAQSLLQKNGFLTYPAVAKELAKLLLFQSSSDVQLIGFHWKDSMDFYPPSCDFTREAETFVDFLKDELREAEEFRSVFDSHALDQIAINTSSTSTSFTSIESQLTQLSQLMEGHYGAFLQALAGATLDLRGQICDQTGLILEKISNFVGRQFVFDRMDQFIASKPCGYFFISGEPGIGKSSLSAYLIKTRGYLHHFNIRSEGINKTDTFLKNLCAQLIITYRLPYNSLPPEAIKDSRFLKRLLDEASRKNLPDHKIVILVDAIDEVDTTSQIPGENLLHLPQTLPHNIYIVITSRNKIPYLRIDCEKATFEIQSDMQANIADIRAYLQDARQKPGIQTYMSRQGLDDAAFIDRMAEKSQGNFIYLHYVLPEIESGAYADFSLKELPEGLKNYYEDDWQRMKEKDKNNDWFDYKLPVLAVLAAVIEPVCVDRIAEFSNIQNKSRIWVALDEWQNFLKFKMLPYINRLQKHYYFYHSGFHDFISQKEDIAEERIRIAQNIQKILYNEVMGDE